MSQQCMQALVSGRVQGVYFRQSTLQQAQALGLRGWVRNLSDGRVEVWYEGDEQALRHLSRWLEQGPAQAQVHGLELHRQPVQGFVDFQLLR